MLCSPGQSNLCSRLPLQANWSGLVSFVCLFKNSGVTVWGWAGGEGCGFNCWPNLCPARSHCYTVKSCLIACKTPPLDAPQWDFLKLRKPKAETTTFPLNLIRPRYPKLIAIFSISSSGSRELRQTKLLSSAKRSTLHSLAQPACSLTWPLLSPPVLFLAFSFRCCSPVSSLPSSPLCQLNSASKMQLTYYFPYIT